MGEQRNPYKDDRVWLRLGSKSPTGNTFTLDMVVDTGCPYPVILPPTLMHRVRFGQTQDMVTNFGLMAGYWVRVYSPELDFVEFVKGYTSSAVGDAVAADHPDFAGLVGLPVLRLGEYGGNADSFWFRYPPSSPTGPS